MAIFTIKSHVSRALDFYNKANDITKGMYFGIGKREAWDATDLGDSFDPLVDYEQSPPIPKNTDEIEDIIGFKQVESAYLVVPDPMGGLEYRGTRWRSVSPLDAVTEGARWVYISTYLSYSELSTSTVYRQIGVYSGVTRAEGVPISKQALELGEVADLGILEIVDNRKPLYRSGDMRELMKLVIEF